MRIGFRFYWGTNPLAQPWNSIVLMLLGLGFAYGAIYNYIEAVRFIETSVEIRGTVTSIENKGGMFYPVIQFRDANSQKHFIHSSIGSSPSIYEPGETVKVYYSKTNPNDARIGTFWNIWFLVLFFAVFAVSFSSVSVVLWFVLK